MSSAYNAHATLLCIDDNQDVLECVKEFLETFGYTVLTAPSGPKGLELASMEAVDIVIVDYMMPEMNGREFAIQMRRLKPELRIIMLSAATDIPQQTLNLVDAFVAKDRLSSHLLPVITRLHEGGQISSRTYEA